MLKRRGVIALLEPKRNSTQKRIEAHFQSAAERVADNPDALVFGDSLAMTIDEILGGRGIRARFMTLRSKDSSPVQYDPRSGLTPIAIPPGSYIADVMHLIILSPECHALSNLPAGAGCLVFDRHNNGPTLGELSHYLNDHLRLSVNLVSLYNRNLASELADMEGQLRRIDIGFVSHGPSALDGRGSGSDGLFANLRALNSGDRIPSVGVSLGVGRSRRDEYLPQDIQDDAMQIAGNAGELVETMKLLGRLKSTGEIKELNILRQRVGEHLEFEESRGAPTMPDPEDAYRKLEGMFTSFSSRGLVEDAISARLIFRS